MPLRAAAAGVLRSGSMQEAQPQGLASEGVPQPLRVLVPSPIGPLGVELLRTAITRLLIDPIGAVQATFTPLHEIDGSDFLDEVFGRLSEYFAGARRKLDLEFDLAPSGVSGYARRVLREVAKIPYGRTRTYQGLADISGRPGAAPQVVSALLANPIPILVPCHRVVAGEPGIGSYIAGAERKLWLLQLEIRGAERV
jgi:methylated-DNA-[protein]-cysteine S-methyltransferase